MIKSLEDNILPRNLIPHLQQTCKGRRETELKNCIENILLAFDNVVVNTSHQVDHESVLIQFGLGKIYRDIDTQFCTIDIDIISVHIMKPEEGAIQFTFQDTLEINLEPGLKYFVGVSDTKYALMTVNPKIVPGKLFKLSKNNGLVLVYFDVGP